MPTSEWNDPVDELRNPHRGEERRAVRAELTARLHRRHVEIGDDESDVDLLAIANAVEAFEARAAQLGADSLTNDITIEDPDEIRFVLPARGPGEAGATYASRVMSATAALDA